MGGVVISLVRAGVIAAVVIPRWVAISVIIAGRPIIIARVTIPVSVAGVVGRRGIIRISVGSVWVTPAPAPPRTPAPPPWKAEVADKDDVVEIVESVEAVESIEAVKAVKAVIPNETAIIEAVETTKSTISIEVSIAKASDARR